MRFVEIDRLYRIGFFHSYFPPQIRESKACLIIYNPFKKKQFIKKAESLVKRTFRSEINSNKFIFY